MPHTFNNTHTTRHSHNGVKPVNHKATRMHAKIDLNKPQIYSLDPNFFTSKECEFFYRGRVNTSYWNDLQAPSIIGAEYDLQECKETLDYLREYKKTQTMIDDIPIDNIPIDVLIEDTMKQCQELDACIEFLDKISTFHIDSNVIDHFDFPRKLHKRSSHRVSREKSLPNTRLDRKIKKQIFYN